MRKHIHRLSILMIVVGLLCVIIGGLFALAALSQYEHERSKFFNLALYFAGTGLIVLIARYLFILLPAKLKEHRSGVVSRRKELAKLYKRPKPSEHSDGGILLLALILLGIVSAAATFTIVSAQASEKEASVALKSELLRLAAIDSARHAMKRLADDTDLTVDHLNEPWAEATEITDASGTIRMTRIRDMHSAFDLNNLSVDRSVSGSLPAMEVAANLLIQCGVFRPGQKIEAVRDWVDQNNSGLYESSFYASKDPPSAVPNRLLRGWEELLNVEGWTPEVFERKLQISQKSLFESDVLDCFTIIPVPRSRSIPLNINSVDPGVLQSLLGFSSDSLVARIIRRRRAQPYRELTSLANTIGLEEFKKIKPYVDVKSRYFHIDVHVFADEKKASIQLIASRDDDGQVKVVEAFF